MGNIAQRCGPEANHRVKPSAIFAVQTRVQHYPVVQEH